MDVGLARMPHKPAGAHGGFPHGAPPADPSRLPVLGGTGLQSPTPKAPSYAASPSSQQPESTGLPHLSRSKANRQGRESEFLEMYGDRRKKQPGRSKSILSQTISNRNMAAEDDKPKHFNTEPMPFQSQSFNGPPLQKVQIVGVGVSLPNLGSNHDPKQRHTNRSSTMMKKVATSKRHGEMWTGQDAGKHRGYIVHTDRYQWDGYGRPLDSPTQRDRLQAEFEYMERLRGLKRKRELVPHRESYDFLMGGHKASLNERMDIMREINQLRSVVLPTKAKDLYVGRGFAERLPVGHALNAPRGNTVIADAVTQSAPSAPGRAPTRFPIIRLPKPKPTAKPSLLPKTKSSLAAGYDSQTIKNKYRMPPVNLHHASVLDPGLGRGRGTNLVIHPPPVSSTDQQYATPKDPWPQGNTGQGSAKIPSSVVDRGRPVTSDMNTGPEEPRPPSRPRSGVSPAKSVSPTKAATPNPLTGWPADSLMEEEELNTLRQTFKRLDTDADGHLMFQQLQSQLPKELTSSQEKFVQQVYQISNKSTFFGIDEFVSLSVLCNSVIKLEDEVAAAYDKLDFSDLSKTIIQYVELFQSVDRAQTGKISHDALREVLSTARDTEISEEVFTGIKEHLSKFGGEEVSKLDYISLIPYFLSLQL